MPRSASRPSWCPMWASARVVLRRWTERRAERLLLQAIEQDAASSRAHETLGTLRRIQNRLEEGRVEFATAVALDRNNPHALLGLGQMLMFLGRPEEALPAIEASL